MFVTRPTLADYAASVEEMRVSAARLLEVIGSGVVEVQIGARYPLREPPKRVGRSNPAR